MKTVAFDVFGTIEGPKKQLVLRLFRGLQAKGIDCIVWSNSIHYAADAVTKNCLGPVTYEWKRTKTDFEDWDKELYDLAIEDDRSQTYLASKSFLFVDELTDQKVDDLLNSIQ